MRYLILPLLITNAAAACTYITQQSGQYCWDLAQVCKITVDQLVSYNPNVKSDCSGLVTGQKICCTAGGLAPTQNPDGSCAAYKVRAGDYCGKIAADNGLSVEDLERFNGQTWGWMGCANLQLDMNICLSTGTPPRPTPDPAASCGMTAPGALFNTGCPLNACCSQWGYCGVSEEFCATKTSPTNAPGTTGCQSHCEIGYHANTGPPSEFVKIGYFETWNLNRECSRMSMLQLQMLIDKERYTHIHYAFGVISDYTPKIEDMNMWNEFLGLRNVKKVISFGGWAFSTDDGTRPIFGDAVLTDQFVRSLVNMAAQYNLDGIDIDWEYPGATDLKGWADSTPTVHPNDGENYVNFLAKLRSALPSHVSVSICAPASFWYLKNFPIDRMNAHLDYIVFMTYDLHGQWDINIESLGPKLLSHVNKTETINALAMITKAGMDSNKVVMGVASYGRAFWQSNPNCSGPTCTFTSRGATPGKCTKESSYLGYGEIEDIIRSGNVRGMYYDAESDSDILMYNTNDWVAYTNLSTTMKGRYEMAKSMNLKGTVEWAVDLRASDNDVDSGDIVYYESFNIVYKDCPNDITTIEQVEALDPNCMYYGLVQYLWHTLGGAIDSYNKMLSNNYAYLYSEKYLPYAITNGEREHIIFWDTATIENNVISSSFDKHVSCGADCVQGGPVTLKRDIKDIAKAFSEYMQSSYVLNLGNFRFPYSYEHDEGQNIIDYQQFPMINNADTYIDPSKEINDHRDAVNAMAAMLTDVYNNPQNYDHVDVVDAVMYNVISFDNAVQGMKNIMEVGNKIVEQEQKAAANFILSIIMSLVEIIVAFVPVVGPILSTTIGVIYSIASGDTDPIGYIFAAAGAIDDLYTLFKAGSKFDDIAKASRSFKGIDNLKSFRHLDLKDLRVGKVNNIKSKANMCKL